MRIEPRRLTTTARLYSERNLTCKAKGSRKANGEYICKVSHAFKQDICKLLNK